MAWSEDYYYHHIKRPPKEPLLCGSLRQVSQQGGGDQDGRCVCLCAFSSQEQGVLCLNPHLVGVSRSLSTRLGGVSLRDKSRGRLQIPKTCSPHCSVSTELHAWGVGVYPRFVLSCHMIDTFDSPVKVMRTAHALFVKGRTPPPLPKR